MYVKHTYNMKIRTCMWKYSVKRCKIISCLLKSWGKHWALKLIK